MIVDLVAILLVVVVPVAVVTAGGTRVTRVYDPLMAQFTAAA